MKEEKEEEVMTQCLVMRRISKLYYMRLEIRLYYMILDSTTLYYFLSYIKV